MRNSLKCRCFRNTKQEIPKDFVQNIKTRQRFQCFRYITARKILCSKISYFLNFHLKFLKLYHVLCNFCTNKKYKVVVGHTEKKQKRIKRLVMIHIFIIRDRRVELEKYENESAQIRQTPTRQSLCFM